MPHSYEHVVDTQQSTTVGDELYNLTQLAEVSIVYFENHTAAIVENSKTFDKVSATRTPASLSVLNKFFIAGHLKIRWDGERDPILASSPRTQNIII